MRILVLLAAITFVQICTNQCEAQMASIYTPGYAGAVGPWQPNRFAPGYYYYNASAPQFPVYGYGGGYGPSYNRYLREETLYETRRIRRAAEYESYYRPRRGR